MYINTYPNSKQHISAFTMIELLLVISIIALVFAISVSGLKPSTQIFKSYDAVKKSDLNKIKIAYEDYFTDNDCYPNPDVLNYCNTQVEHQLTPYLPVIPCNPDTKTPYVATITYGTTCPRSFAIYTKLANEHDTIISQLGCTDGCGPGATYNYAVTSSDVEPSVYPPITPSASPNPSASPSPSPSISPSPSPSPIPLFYCQSYSPPNCTSLPAHLHCAVSFSDPACSDSCANPANMCIPS